MKKSLQERFIAKTTPEPNTGCWLWTASLNNNGYGRLKIKGKTIGAHRVAYELYKGEIPEGNGFHGVCVLHICDIRSCVNPDHLFLGTIGDNIKDMIDKGRHTRGENCALAKLSEEQIVKIRKDRGTLQDIGKRFNVTPQTISYIRRGETWKHI